MSGPQVTVDRSRRGRGFLGVCCGTVFGGFGVAFVAGMVALFAGGLASPIHDVGKTIRREKTLIARSRRSELKRQAQCADTPPGTSSSQPAGHRDLAHDIPFNIVIG